MQRLIWLALGSATVAQLSYYLRHGIWPLTADGRLKFADVAAFWSAGIRVLNGQAQLIYDYRLHDPFQAALLNLPQPNGLAFPYPPHALFFTAPLGLLSYGQAWLAFLLPGMAIYFSILRRLSGDSITALGMTLAIGGATQCITLGQNGFYTASLLTGGLMLLQRNKVAAGILFGLLTVKPHLGIALAAALLLWREWRVIAVTCATAASLAIGATISFGPGIWSAFWKGNAAFAVQIADKQTTLIDTLMQSVFALAHPYTGLVGAAVVQGVASVLTIIVLARISNLTDDWEIRAPALIASTLLVSPFLYLYDATMLTAAAAILLRNSGAKERFAIFVALLVPALWYLRLGSHVPISAFLFLMIAYLRALKTQHPQVRLVGDRPGIQELRAGELG